MASFAVNQASPEASKSSLLKKTCPSWIGSKSNSHNHCAKVLAVELDLVQPPCSTPSTDVASAGGMKPAPSARNPKSLRLFPRKLTDLVRARRVGDIEKVFPD